MFYLHIVEPSASRISSRVIVNVLLLLLSTKRNLLLMLLLLHRYLRLVLLLLQRVEGLPLSWMKLKLLRSYRLL